MALASQNPEETKKQADDHETEQAALNRSPGRDGTAGESRPDDNRGEGERGYGRQGGSIADTGRRTDDPVGVEQIESARVTKTDPETAREHQQSPGTGSPEHGAG